jgi:hypothetical protein
MRKIVAFEFVERNGLLVGFLPMIASGICRLCEDAVVSAESFRWRLISARSAVERRWC